MKIAICELESFSPYGQGKYHSTEKKDKELISEYVNSLNMYNDSGADASEASSAEEKKADTEEEKSAKAEE